MPDDNERTEDLQSEDSQEEVTETEESQDGDEGGAQEPAWLPRRLTRERSKGAQDGQAALLKRYGASKPEELDARLERLKALEDAQLSEQERKDQQLESLQAERDAAAQERDAARAELAEVRARQAWSRAAVKADAPADPEHLDDLYDLAAKRGLLEPGDDGEIDFEAAVKALKDARPLLFQAPDSANTEPPRSNGAGGRTPPSGKAKQEVVNNLVRGAGVG